MTERRAFQPGWTLPPSWQWKRIGDISHVATGGTPDTSCPEYYGGEVNWLKSGDVKGVYIDAVPQRITEFGLQNSNAIVHPQGSVMLAMSGQGKTRGTSAVLRVPSACSQSVAAILPSPMALPEIIHWALVLRYADIRHATGDGERTGLNLKNVRDIVLPLPPLAEQERIAARLTEQLAAVASARAAAQARLAAAEALPAAYLREVFEGPEASEWETRQLGELIQRHNEIIHPGDREFGEATFVGLEHIESATGRRTGSLRIDLGKLTGRKPAFRKGQIVYGYLRPYLNKVWIAEFDGFSSVDQFAFDVFDEIADTAFVAAFMRSDTFLRRSEVVTTTGQLPRISIDEILAVRINVPAVDIQHRIAAALALRLTEAERLTAILREELAAIDTLPAALLRDAFNGQP